MTTTPYFLKYCILDVKKPDVIGKMTSDLKSQNIQNQFSNQKQLEKVIFL